MFSRAFILIALFVGTLAEEGEEEEIPTSTAVAVAASLIGAISFQMSLFYLMNHIDADIRKYTYEIINSTVSIFSAVLLFQSANDIVKLYIGAGWYVDFMHMFLWYTILEIALAWISGAISIRSWEMPTSEPELARAQESMELQMKSIALLLAHLTGFASINAWGSLQQMDHFKSPFLSFLVIPISALGQFSLQRLTNWIRYKVSMGDDGDVDEFEEMWDEETQECENDVMGLTLSFNLIQACRFLITSVLPNQEGEVPEATLLAHGGNVQVSELYFVAFLSMALMALIFVVFSREHGGEHGEGNEHGHQKEHNGETKNEEGWSFFEGVRERAEDTVIITLSMSFAWSCFFCTRMLLTRVDFLMDPMLRAVALAMILSFASFSCIRVLDILADKADERKEWQILKNVVVQIIKAIAILVGFSWEQCFDQAVVSLSSATPDPHFAKLFLGLFCVALVVPAWKWYLLPMAISNGWKFGFVVPHDAPEHKFDDILSHISSRKEKLHTPSSQPELGKRIDNSTSKSKLKRRGSALTPKGSSSDHIPPVPPNFSEQSVPDVQDSTVPRGSPAQEDVTSSSGGYLPENTLRVPLLHGNSSESQHDDGAYANTQSEVYEPVAVIESKDEIAWLREDNARIPELEAMVRALQGENARLTVDNTSMQADNLQDEIAYLRADIARIPELEAYVRALQGENATLQADNADEIARLRADVARIPELEAYIRALQGENASLQADNTDEIARLRADVARIPELEAYVRSLQGENATLQSNNTDMIAKLQADIARIPELEASVRALQEENASLQAGFTQDQTMRAPLAHRNSSESEQLGGVNAKLCDEAAQVTGTLHVAEPTQVEDTIVSPNRLPEESPTAGNFVMPQAQIIRTSLPNGQRVESQQLGAMSHVQPYPEVFTMRNQHSQQSYGTTPMAQSPAPTLWSARRVPASPAPTPRQLTLSLPSQPTYLGRSPSGSMSLPISRPSPTLSDSQAGSMSLAFSRPGLGGPGPSPRLSEFHAGSMALPPQSPKSRQSASQAWKPVGPALRQQIKPNHTSIASPTSSFKQQGDTLAPYNRYLGDAVDRSWRGVGASQGPSRYDMFAPTALRNG